MRKNCILIILAFVGCVNALALPPEHEWVANVRAVDESGRPVPGAKIRVSYGMEAEQEISGLTDTNGILVASHRDAGIEWTIIGEKTGYYGSSYMYFKGTYDYHAWHTNLEVSLKRVIHPIPMYAKSVDERSPENGKPIGYDLTIGDWVGPYGKGVHEDIIFEETMSRKSFHDYDYQLVVRFSNPGDGICEFDSPRYYLNSQGSELRSLQNAPEAGYVATAGHSSHSHPGEPPIVGSDDHRNYYIRVRTVLDTDGKVLSACYGKIYGDFMQFSYYLNPTPNDRNVEFDPKRNLLKNLKFGQGVRDP